MTRSGAEPHSLVLSVLSQYSYDPIYELTGPAGSNLWVTEQQDPSWWAPAALGSAQGQSTGSRAGVFDDYIAGSAVGNSLQTFTVLPEDPRKVPSAPACPVNVQLPSGPNGQQQDYGTLGMWHGGFIGRMFINGNSTGWVRCKPSYDLPGRM